jgi:ankyrin repeat protein
MPSHTRIPRKSLVIVILVCLGTGLTIFCALGFLFIEVMRKESIHHAAATGDVRELEATLDRHPDWIENRNRLDCTPLLMAVMKGQPETTRILLKRGADIRATWNKVRSNDGAWSVLHIAANWNRVELLEMLIDAGADINAISVRGETPCDVAFGSGNWDMLDALDKRGGVRSDELRRRK